MKRILTLACLSAILFCSCQKKIESIVNSITSKNANVKTAEFTQYFIPQGEQYSSQSSFVQTSYQQLSFIVRFDSSAIYQTVSSNNQNDINKLFGFSDNKAQHHQFSARFGWRWSNNALRLFAYVYNNSVMTSKELGTVPIGSENSCSIKVNGSNYLFTLNGKETTMPRASTTATAEGYKLYPYFGGDETAPHPISIWIREL